MEQVLEGIADFDRQTVQIWYATVHLQPWCFVIGSLSVQATLHMVGTVLCIQCAMFN